jgi:hypothetical protein
MDLLLFQREDISLLRVLLESETSRGVIRFYHPIAREWGIEISLTSLGSALALVSELRWYIRRYVGAVLFSVGDALYCTPAVARRIYDERELVELTGWPYRKRFHVAGSRLREGPGPAGDPGRTFEVLCTEDEYSGATPLLPASDETFPDDMAAIPPGDKLAPTTSSEPSPPS